jgi:2Fe-2S ferredoxin
MPVIHILPHGELAPQGARIEAPAGTSICEALIDNGIHIEHACEMSCACTTCHVIVKEGLLHSASSMKPKRTCSTGPGA